MDYWAEVMQDDLFILVQDGWEKAARLRLIVEEKGQKTKETPDLLINRKKYKADLIPPTLIIARYFAQEQQAIKALEAAKEALTQELEAFIEEHGGEEGTLEETKTDAGKVTKASLKARFTEVKRLPDVAEELVALQKCQRLMDREAAAGAKVKAAQKVLDDKVLAQYGKLDEAAIKALVVEDKWLATLKASVQGEIERVTQSLAGRVKTLEERYADPMPKLVDEVAELSSRVVEHLKRMGLSWN